MLYGEANSCYERAVKSHERHASQHGYDSYVLRHEIMSGYWNKPLYILSLITQQLALPPKDRIAWFMYVRKAEEALMGRAAGF